MKIVFNGVSLDGVETFDWVTEELMEPAAPTKCSCTGWTMLHLGCQCGSVYNCKCSAFDIHNFGCRCKKQKGE